ncbi:hypothetical protein MSP8887_00313 [Marinomonas spartinae]|uniref:conjugal transfer protein TraF n=1 Tax=Marinomonas spartinae TaxID=1792290 RepID=UPI000808D436|nr:conjugal transfer protein TraF [Marinomonas spartinae]SBS26011.1 hypothetical protein MSP8887_00313 [Marinomonas spartinae]
MKIYISMFGALFSSLTMAAMPVYLPVGSSYTLSGVINPRALSTSLSNPAAPYLMGSVSSGQNVRLGLLGPVGLSYELGEVGNLTDKVDDLESLLNRTDYQSQAEVNAAIAKANSIVSDVASTAYIKVAGSSQIPFMPFIYKTNTRGAFIVDASASFLGRANVLADDIVAEQTGSSYKVKSKTSFYVKKATDLRLGLGYSQSVVRTSYGELIGGVKANLHRISLGRSLVVLADENDDASKVFTDSLFSDQHASSNVGIDVGAIWVSNHYQLGATVTNINQPKFDYADLGDCANLSGSKLTSCNAAVVFSGKGKLDLSETYQMKTQSTIDGAITSRNRQWILAGSYDLNSVKDPVGDKYRWAVASLSFFSDNLIAPGFRVGYRENLVGSQLKYVTGGLTFFRRLNLDVAVSTGTTEYNGHSIPRSAYFSIGYDMAF